MYFVRYKFSSISLIIMPIMNKSVPGPYNKLFTVCYKLLMTFMYNELSFFGNNVDKTSEILTEFSFSHIPPNNSSNNRDYTDPAHCFWLTYEVN